MKFFYLLLFSFVITNCNAGQSNKINASFDCNKASQPIEVAICSNSDLAKLDIEMSGHYMTSREQLPSDEQKLLKKIQLNWLKNREINCDINKSTLKSNIHVNCLIRSYKKRINELKSTSIESNSYYKRSISAKHYSLLDRLKWQKLIKWPKSCEFERLEHMSNAGLDFYKIDKDKTIIKVMCNRFAYQGQYQLYLLEASDSAPKSKPLLIPQIRETGGTWKSFKSNKVTGLFQYYPKDQSFLTLNKYSGAGQCGHSLTYKSNVSDSDINIDIDKAWGNADCSKDMTQEDWPEINLSAL